MIRWLRWTWAWVPALRDAWKRWRWRVQYERLLEEQVAQWRAAGVPERTIRKWLRQAVRHSVRSTMLRHVLGAGQPGGRRP